MEMGTALSLKIQTPQCLGKRKFFELVPDSITISSNIVLSMLKGPKND